MAAAVGVLYEITVAGRLGPRSLRAFPGLVPHDVEGGTCLRGRLADQAALHGVIARVRDLGLPLLSVRVIESEALRSGKPE